MWLALLLLAYCFIMPNTMATVHIMSVEVVLTTGLVNNRRLTGTD